MFVLKLKAEGLIPRTLKKQSLCLFPFVYVYVHVGVYVCLVGRGQHHSIGAVHHSSWDRVSNCPGASYWLDWQVNESQGFFFFFQMCILEIWTWVLMLAWKVLYWLSHLFSMSVSFRLRLVQCRLQAWMTHELREGDLLTKGGSVVENLKNYWELGLSLSSSIIEPWLSLCKTLLLNLSTIRTLYWDMVTFIYFICCWWLTWHSSVELIISGGSESSKH